MQVSTSSASYICCKDLPERKLCTMDKKLSIITISN